MWWEGLPNEDYFQVDEISVFFNFLSHQISKEKSFFNCQNLSYVARGSLKYGRMLDFFRVSHFFLSPNLATLYYEWSPLWLNHKIEKKTKKKNNPWGQVSQQYIL